MGENKVKKWKYVGGRIPVALAEAFAALAGRNARTVSAELMLAVRDRLGAWEQGRCAGKADEIGD